MKIDTKKNRVIETYYTEFNEIAGYTNYPKPSQKYNKYGITVKLSKEEATKLRTLEQKMIQTYLDEFPMAKSKRESLTINKNLVMDTIGKGEYLENGLFLRGEYDAELKDGTKIEIKCFNSKAEEIPQNEIPYFGKGTVVKLKLMLVSTYSEVKNSLRINAKLTGVQVLKFGANNSAGGFTAVETDEDLSQEEEVIVSSETLPAEEPKEQPVKKKKKPSTEEVLDDEIPF